MNVKAACSDDELDNLLAYTQQHSPVCNTVCRPVPVKVQRVPRNQNVQHPPLTRACGELSSRMSAYGHRMSALGGKRTSPSKILGLPYGVARRDLGRSNTRHPSWACFFTFVSDPYAAAPVPDVQ
jgi:hypothetical protein